MIPYWLLFILPAWLAISRLRPLQNRPTRWSGLWLPIFGLLVLMIGLRHEVGGDWASYIRYVHSVTNVTLQEALSKGDPAYNLLNWLAVESGLGVYFTNTVCAAIFAWGLLVFCRAQPRPWLALTVAVPYLVIVVAMGYTRQGTAIGLAMLGLVALTDGKLLRFAVFVVFAALFHKSAVVLMPLAVLSSTKRKVWTIIWVGLSSVIFYGLLLEDSVETFTTNYIEAEYQSSGAAIRVAMNAVPAVLFLWFRRRFAMSEAQRSFWTWMSLGAIIFVVVLQISPSSTAVDRMALYWIPLQLFVLARLPNAIGKPNGSNQLLVFSVVFYSAFVQFVWLFFSVHAYLWLPYQFYPFVGLFE